MVKILSLSLLLCMLSVIIILAFPIGNIDSDLKVGPSPYRVQIDELYIKTSKGLPPSAPEWKQLETLIKKNNQWFEVSGESTGKLESLSFFNILKLKSSKASFLLMLIWGIGFYLILKIKKDYLSIVALAFPLLLFMLSIISVLALTLISIAILGVYCVTFLKIRNKREGNSN